VNEEKEGVGEMRCRELREINRVFRVACWDEDV
jgi:hypothetical protein